MQSTARAVEIVKTYGSGDTLVTALDHVSIEFGEGEFTAIMGPSGSGNADLGNGVRWAHGNDHDAACGNLCAYFTG